SLEGLVYPDFEEQVRADMCVFTVPTAGGMDFGFRNPFAAIWGHLDRDNILWIFGERYVREQSLFQHVGELPDGVMWFADPSGAEEIATMRKLNVKVRKGNND